MAGVNLRFVSRLPETYKLAAELKERAWQDNQWRPIGRLAESSSGAVYRSRSYTATLYGREYRFIVVHSSSKNARSVKALAHRTEMERTALEAALAQLQKERFNCQEDAQKAWEALVSRPRLNKHRLEREGKAEEMDKLRRCSPLDHAPVLTLT